MKNQKASLFLGAVFSAIILIFVSCDIGLGSAVDTQPPAISITTPATDGYVIRDNFTISGAQSDDRGVTKITVMLTSTEDTSLVYKDFSPEFDNDAGEWSCQINAVEKDSAGKITKHVIKDGVYTATITAYDSFKQTNTVTRTFTIDNTAPLVVLTSPSTKSITSGTVFGQNLYLDGTVYDANTVDTIDVLVYDDENDPSSAGSVVKDTIKIANASSLEQASVADWSTEVLDGLNDYQTIYGNDIEAGTKAFYFTLKTYDKARRLPSDENDRGNETEIFFFNDDISESILKTLKPSGTYNLLKTDYEESDSSSRTAETTVNTKVLYENLKKAQQTQGTFQLNPQNNPTFVVSGYDPVSTLPEPENGKGILENTDIEFSIGQSLVVTFSRGRDNNPLMPETFGINLIKADKTGNIYQGDQACTEVLLAPYYAYDSDGNWGQTEAGKADTEDKYNTDLLSSVGTSYTATIPIDKKEGYYWVEVYGYDQNGIYDYTTGEQIKDHGNAIVDKDGKNPHIYALRLMGTATAPNLHIYKTEERKNEDEFTSASTIYIRKGETLAIYGTAEDTTGQYRQLEVNFYKDSTSNEPIKTISAVSGTTNADDNKFNWTITAEELAKLAGNTDAENPSVSSSYTIYVQALEPQSTLEKKTSINITYDCNAPAIGAVTVSPTVEETIGEGAESVTTEYVNGKIKIKAAVEDDISSSVTTTYTIGDDSTEYTIEKLSSGFEINTFAENFADNAATKITIYAKDVAGNVASKEITLNVKQSTDTPVINFNNANVEISDAAGIAAANENIFGKSSNKIMATVTDDDGFAADGIQISVQKLKYNSETKEYENDGETSTQKYSPAGTSQSISWSLNTTEKAAYFVTLSAVDSKQETQLKNEDEIIEKDFSSKSVGPFFVVFDDENPEIKISSTNGDAYSKQAYSKSEQEVKVVGTVSDDSGIPVSVVRYAKDDIAESGEPKADASGTVLTVTDGNWTDSIIAGSTDANYYYIATDVYGKSTSAELVLKIDNIAPSFDLDNSKIGGKIANDVMTIESIWFNTTNLTFDGRYQEDGSGIKTLAYTISASDKSSAEGTTITSAIEKEGTKYETFKATMDSFKASAGSVHNTITFIATDYAGNSSTQKFTIRIDEASPAVSLSNYQYDEEASKNWSSVILTNKSKAITVKGTAEDASSGVAAIKLIVGTNEYEVNAADNWSYTIPTSELDKLSTGAYTAKIRVTDTAGNYTDSDTFSIKVDDEKPVVTLKSPVATTAEKETKINGNISFSGISSDNNAPVSVAMYYKTGTAAPESLSEMKLLQKKSTANEENVTTVDVTDLYSCSFSKNVSDLLEGSATSDTLYVAFDAFDEAGNESEFAVNKYTIDLDSDRPVIKFSSIDKPAAEADAYLKSSKLTASITDDDGIDTLKLYLGKTKPADGDWIEVTPGSGTFTYTISEDDGSKNLWVYVKDTAGTEFVTGSVNEAGENDLMKQPKLYYSNEAESSAPTISSASSFGFVLDTTSPQIESIKYAAFDAAPEDADAIHSATYSEMTTSNVVGGTLKQYVTFAIELESGESNIASVTASTTVSGAEKTYSFEKASDGVTWYSALEGGIVDVENSSFPTDTYTFTFTVTDSAGYSTAPTKTLTVDNNGPAANLSSPLTTDEVTGTVTLIGTAVDDNSSVETIKYLVADSSIIGDELALDAIEDDSYAGKENTGTSASSWKFVVDDLPSTSDELTNYKKYEILKSAIGVSGSAIVYKGTGVYQLPLYLYAVDSLGNKSISSTTIIYNPFGDRPEIEITSPSDEANLNGTIQILGGASDNVSVKEVYVQIDADNDDDFDSDDISILETLTNPADDSQIYTIASDSDAAFASADLSAISDSFWGIKASGTSSWNLSINKYKEFQIPGLSLGDGTNKYKVSYRAVAFDNNYKAGKWSETRSFVIDTNIPSVSTTGKVYGYSDSERTSKTSEKSYSADMYLTSENNYSELQVQISDKNGIQKVEYYKAETIEALTSATTPVVADITADEDAETIDTYYTKVTAKIPLTKLSGDTLAIKIVAYKNSETVTTAYCNYNVNFDNTAPQIDKITFNGDVVKSKAEDEDAANQIVNSNAVFTLGGKTTDYGSGFARALFYYNRPVHGDNPNRIYDPLVAPTTADNVTTYNGKKVVTSADTIILGKKYDDDGVTVTDAGQTLYGHKYNVTVAEDKKTLTCTDSSETFADDFIFAGGVVYISGSWYDIDTVSNSSIILSDDTLVCAAGNYEAFFPYARVINNTGTEKNGFNTGSTDSAYDDSTDDGDGMPESVIKSQSSWTFDASVRSNFIPDGPGSLVVFVFDKAGNCSAAAYDGSVQNKAPRITKLWLGTDLSSDGKYDSSEFTSYNILERTGEEQRKYVMSTADFGGKRFRILNGLAVVTEFVGGNNVSGKGIGLAYNNAVTTVVNEKEVVNNNAVQKVTTDEENNIKGNWYTSQTIGGTTGITADSNFFTASDYSGIESKNNYAYIIPKADIGDDSTGTITNLTNRDMSFTFWDDTEDSEQGINSGYCYLMIKDFAVIQDDNFAPSVAINPFFWNNADDNSLYNNDYMNGHIELSENITENSVKAARKSGTADDGLYYIKTTGGDETDVYTLADPKVSGIISIRGSAVDEHSLGKIWASFDGFTPEDSQKTFGSTTATQFDLDENGTVVTGAPVYYCVAYKDSEGKWQTVNSSGNASESSWKFTKVTDVSSQSGNIITWQLDVDTSSISGNMGNNKSVRIVAQDSADSIHSSSTSASAAYKLEKDSGGNWLNTYDVNTYNVPSYQMDVVPYISGIEGTNRSRLGRYPVQAGASIKITGFNFAESPKVYRKTTAGVSNEVTVTASDSTSITITAPDYSGYIYAQWGTGDDAVTTPNNDTLNDTIGYNIEKGYVAGETDGGKSLAEEAGTNFWTDDRYLSVWNVNTSFENRSKPINGMIKKAGSTAVRRRVDDGSEWKEPSAGTIYSDNIIATWASTDDLQLYDKLIGDGETKSGRTVGITQATFYEAPPVFDMCIINNIPWYVALDNYVGNNSATDWGMGLFVGRQGTQFNKGNLGKEKTQNTCMIESQGDNKVGSCSAGYDAKKNQFINPSINGYYDKTANRHYIYVSYYDSYARCLKYAAYYEDAVNDLNGTALIGMDSGSWDGRLKVLMRTTGTNMTTGNAVVAGYDTLRTNESEFEEEAGEWSKMLIDGTTPVIIYYNKTTSSIEVARASAQAPVSGNIRDADGNLKTYTKTVGEEDVSYTDNASEVWYKTRNIKPAGTTDFGRYLSAEMDSSGNIHVVSSDNDTGVMYYLCLTKDGNTYSKSKEMVIDSTAQVGDWTGLYMDGSTPYVSYLNKGRIGSKAAVKVAYLDGTAFESMTVPAKYESTDSKTTIVAGVRETVSAEGIVSKLAVGFNSNVFAIDFLRGE